MAIRKARLLRDVPTVYHKFKRGEAVEVRWTFTLCDPKRVVAEINDPVESGVTHLIYEDMIEYIDNLNLNS